MLIQQETGLNRPQGGIVHMWRHKACPGSRETPGTWGMKVGCLNAPRWEQLTAPLVYPSEAGI